jgi:hypothetical protein
MGPPAEALESSLAQQCSIILIMIVDPSDSDSVSWKDD